MAKENHFDVIIVGGGCVGMATALKLNTKYPTKKILVLEKEKELATHQTGHNSGVIHSGIYYKPGSYKAKLCVSGRRELVAFAKENNVKHDICGKIIVATDASELAHMNKVYNNGIENGVEDIRKISKSEIKEIEPYCEGIEGLWVGCTGIIDYAEVTKKYATLFSSMFPESRILKGAEAKAFEHNGDITKVITNRGYYTTSYLITCAGLQSDRIAKSEGSKIDTAIVGFRGDYFDLSEIGMQKVRNLIYPVPNPQFPFLGVHFTRMVQGGVECGPNAVFVFKREGYSKTDFSFKDTAQAFGFGGTWKFFAKHWKFGIDEYRRAFSKRLFLERLQKLIPSLTMEDIVPGRAGVRAMALSKEGEMIDDFKIEVNGNALHVINAPSPAATASLAIGAEIVRMASEHFNLN